MKELKAIYGTRGISEEVYAFGEATLARLGERFAAIDGTALTAQLAPYSWNVIRIKL